MTGEIQANQSIRILVAVPFHFRANRLEFLFRTVRALSEYPVAALDITVLTNVDAEEELEQIRAGCKPLFEPFPAWGATKQLLIESHTALEDPWLLPWCHKHLIADKFLKGDYSHFIYIEDDMLLSFQAFNYFLRYRELLKKEGLIPAFQRIEYNNETNRLYFCDQLGVSDFKSRSKVKLDGYEFVNVDFPWSAVLILDRELAAEHIETRSFDRKRSGAVRPGWDLACRAGMGLCFENVPPGFSHRYVSPVNPETMTTPSWSWVYHVPNNYTKDPLQPFGKTRIDQIFAADSGEVQWREPSKLRLYSDQLRRRVAALTGF